MKATGTKTESIIVDINPKHFLDDILKKSLPAFTNDFKIEDGKLFEYERTHWSDSDYVFKRNATDEEIKLYDAYKLILSYITNNQIK